MKRTQCILGIALTVLVVYATLSLAGVMSDLNEAMAATAELEAELAQAHSETQSSGPISTASARMSPPRSLQGKS